jgi:hypothetical protein
MDPEQTRYVLPEAVYLDTNVLRQVSHGESNVEFIELRKNLDLIRASLFVPDVVVKEWVQQRLEEVLEQIENLRKGFRNLGRLLNRGPEKYEEPKELESTLEREMTQYLDSIGMKLVPTPTNIQVDVLIEMAVKKVAPFEKKGEKGFAEKGFRDTIILFTIMQHMKANAFKNAILLSADKIFTEDAVTTRFKNNGLNVLVSKNLAEANGQVEKLIDVQIKFITEEEEQAIKSFLVEHSNQIFDYVLKNAKVSELFLSGLGDFFSSDHIESVLSVRPKGISKVSLGHTVRDEPYPKDIQPITISVSTEFDLLVREYGLPWFFNRPEFPISEPESFQKTRFQSPTPSLKQKAVTREITVEATIQKTDGNYSNLQMQRVLTY